MKADEYEIKKLNINDLFIFEKLILLFHEVFEMKENKISEEQHLLSLLQQPNFVVFAIIHNDNVIGGLTAYELPMYYSKNPEMFIYDIAVKEKFQRKGFGKKLLLSLEEYCKHHNIKTMFVAANEEDKHALKFYHTTGGKAEKVVHFNYSM